MSREKALERAIATYKEKEDKYRRLRQEGEAILRKLIQQRTVNEMKAEATP